MIKKRGDCSDDEERMQKEYEMKNEIFNNLLKQIKLQTEETFRKNYIFENKLKYTKAGDMSPEAIKVLGFNPDNYIKSNGYIVPKEDLSKFSSLTHAQKKEIVK